MSEEDAEMAAVCEETITAYEQSIAAIHRGEWDTRVTRWGRTREQVIAVLHDSLQAVEATLADIRSGIPLIPCPEPDCSHFVSHRVKACPWCSHPLSPSF